MKPQNLHLSDEDLLQSADGELSPKDAVRIRAHLAACWSCRARLGSLEGTIADFIRVHNEADSQLPPSAGPRALLKAQMAATANAGNGSAGWDPRISWMLAAAAMVLCLSAALIALVNRSPRRVRAPRVVVVAIPRSNLTPGSVLLVSREEVCTVEHSNNRSVPVSTQRKVFEEYGISSADARAYEVDYLITPALGGSEDIHNLWPQSYNATAWNAHVKDAIEERLRSLVCAGNLDLETAQRELSQDWIAAYKKYFHTDQPLEISQ
jgi:hypothetical protein